MNIIKFVAVGVLRENLPPKETSEALERVDWYSSSERSLRSEDCRKVTTL